MWEAFSNIAFCLDECDGNIICIQGRTYELDTLVDPLKIFLKFMYMIHTKFKNIISALLTIYLPLLYVNVFQHSRKIWYTCTLLQSIIFFFSHTGSSQSIYWELCDEQLVSINNAVREKKKWNLRRDLQTLQCHGNTDEVLSYRRIFVPGYFVTVSYVESLLICNKCFFFF